MNQRLMYFAKNFPSKDQIMQVGPTYTKKRCEKILKLKSAYDEPIESAAPYNILFTTCNLIQMGWRLAELSTVS